MDPNRNDTVFRLPVTRPAWVAFAAAFALFALLPVPATAQCLEFNAKLWTPEWESQGAFRTATTSSSSDTFSVNGVPEAFDGLIDVKFTGQAFRRVEMIHTEHLQIDGEAVFMNDDGYVVLEFSTDDYGWYNNIGRFTIIDAGGVYAGASGTGTVWIEQWSSYYYGDYEVQWTFTGDPCI